MSKKIILISFLILLTACRNKEKVDDVVKEDIQSESDVEVKSDAEVTSEHSDTADVTTAENSNPVFNLKDIALNQLEDIMIRILC